MPSSSPHPSTPTAVTVTRGSSPVVLGMPHTGTWLPADILEKLNQTGKMLTDTDWHIDQLYSGLLPEVTIVKANFHRYAIDANRDPGGVSLYPGQNTTSLCPLTDFDNQPIYLAGQEPDADEIERRRTLFHSPYHEALATELERVRQLHGTAILYDCHSIRSHIPFLFDGKLPDFSIGTNHGETCHALIEQVVKDICQKAEGFTTVLNGRFKGGWTTRHYGQPKTGIHAIQMELTQTTHLAREQLPFDYDKAKADLLRPHLREILDQLTQLVLSGSLRS
ncbi:N-formylglutamate deformylase [Kiloniella laminariae]|uniref:N-formylglutamate deformylase n=1 Tax=Kiloniella laminariae TaxID=454162 RepID=UPI0006860C92|nr:N-formylglutamate deformylase [Kiloniella laminariae]